MPYSKKQQIAARIALVAKRKGKCDSLKGTSRQMCKSMTIVQLEDFAKGPIEAS